LQWSGKRGGNGKDRIQYWDKTALATRLVESGRIGLKVRD